LCAAEGCMWICPRRIDAEITKPGTRPERVGLSHPVGYEEKRPFLGGSYLSVAAFLPQSNVLSAGMAVLW